MITKLSVLTLVFAVLWQKSIEKPTDVITTTTNSSHLSAIDPVNSAIVDNPNVDVKREHRSPEYGLLTTDYDDYSSEEEEYVDFRHLKAGHKRNRKHHKKPFVFQGNHGCRGYDCGESWYPDISGSYGGQPSVETAGSFATASAGSGAMSSGPHLGGGHSEANAQSASFSFGPYTATFSVAQASSSQRKL